MHSPRVTNCKKEIESLNNCSNVYITIFSFVLYIHAYTAFGKPLFLTVIDYEFVIISNTFVDTIVVIPFPTENETNIIYLVAVLCKGIVPERK